MHLIFENIKMSSGIQLPEVFLYGPKLQRESMKSWVDGIAEDLRQKNHVKWKCIKMICVNLSLEKAMATHSSTLAWKLPWTEEPGRL